MQTAFRRRRGVATEPVTSRSPIALVSPEAPTSGGAYHAISSVCGVAGRHSPTGAPRRRP
jgi:hypothetical protein